MALGLPIVGQLSAEPELRIGDVARLAHKSARAVRLYEEMGLLGPVVRTDGGHRLYCQSVLMRIAWIDKFQGLGFSLSQIREVLAEWTGSEFGPEAMAKVRETFQNKLAETLAQIQDLETLASELQEGLKYLEACTESCSPETLLGHCKSCDQEHVTDNPPELVSGFYACETDQEPS